MEKVNKKSVLKKILIGLLCFIIAFVIINLLIFIPLVKNQLASSIYPEARAYMASAEKINEIYIYPLSHMTHWEHPITKPFYTIRDKLYSKGLSLFPEKEGEREIWWYKIRYVEFRELVEDNLDAYQLNKDYAIPKFVYSKVNRFHDWNNELYDHIQPIADAKITDSRFAKFKLDMFVQLARLYVSMDSLLVLEPRVIAYEKTRDPIPQINWVSNKEVEKYDKIYKTYLNLLEYSKRYDKASYDYFYNDINRRMWGWFLAYKVSYNIMMSRFYNNKLICDDFYLKLYADNQKIMRDYYAKNEKKLSYGVRARMSMESGEMLGVIAYKFKDCENFKDCSKHTLDGLRKYHFASTWEDVKNNELESLEYEKRYDELKRVKIALGNNN